jgi:murein DD-endopeptidase MepM/ murein hydrolase activator NlpD
VVGAKKLTQYEMLLEGRISSNFGTRFHPIDKISKFHAGVDIAVPRGTSVGAAADGVVTFAGKKGGYGNVVIVEHADGHTTFYAHCDKLLVKEGQAVTVGEEIAKSGSTGKSTGPHLHFEVRENGTPIDPLKFLSNVLPKTAER